MIRLPGLRSLAVSSLLLAGLMGLCPDRVEPVERTVRVLSLVGPLAAPEAEVSGLAWYGDRLVLLPQYPERFAVDGEPGLFTLSRADLRAAAEGEGGPLSPLRVPLDTRGLADRIPGYEGLEAIAFRGREALVTVEADDGHGTMGYLIRGTVVGDLERVVLDDKSLVPLLPQTDINNLGYEAVAVVGDSVLVFYEANGAPNPAPRVRVFGLDLSPRGEVPLSSVEYRITDATEPDADGRFWASNFYWPGSRWHPGRCALSQAFGLGSSHRRSHTVERLVELRYTGSSVELTGRAPLQLRLLDSDASRNWEGVVRMDDGFLLVTDRHPQSILAYVEGPEDV